MSDRNLRKASENVRKQSLTTMTQFFGPCASRRPRRVPSHSLQAAGDKLQGARQRHAAICYSFLVSTPRTRTHFCWKFVHA